MTPVGRHVLLLLSLLGLLVSCMPERCPFRLAPPCPYTEYEPCCPPCEPKDCTSYFPFPSSVAPVVLPDCNQELTAANLIQIALSNSPRTRATWAEARIAATQYGISRADYYPDINGAIFGARDRESDFYGTARLRVQNLWKYGPYLTVSWLLLDFGARRANAQAFRESLLAANYMHNREIQDVMRMVLDDYYDYLAKQGQLMAGEADLADALVSLEATNQKYQAGVSDLGDVYLAQTQVAQMELKLLEDEQRLVDTLAQLTQDLGIPSNTGLNLAQIPEAIGLGDIYQHVECLVARAYMQRPDLFAAWADVRSQQQRVKEARARRLPRLDFDGNIGNTTYNAGQNDRYNYLAQVTLSMPLFKGFWYKNKIAEAVAALEKSKAELRDLEVAISREVVQTFRDFQIANEKIQAGQLYVASAAESYDAVLAKYRAGTVDFTTLENALASLADARASLIDVRQEWLTKLTDLAYSMGTLSPRDTVCSLQRPELAQP